MSIADDPFIASKQLDPDQPQEHFYVIWPPVDGLSLAYALLDALPLDESCACISLNTVTGHKRTELKLVFKPGVQHDSTSHEVNARLLECLNAIAGFDYQWLQR